ncbi:alpha-1,6-mannosyl-glycoprotein 2-beta-N-acetylglucosaminyltransferase-like [Agrilus planipennis]|uniref:Alpha-1,6-mannosyl-glycoprotein 2-beta-N-acetylglucosaminyltransferase n=1 Tax=Agrilus planipennis TaxID=224129 RepID=A0A1W4WFW1_AGRPL|nr:alpha-1,6-mannosyl-glycoprotein 2-beta-N-acetylglucosaminyltransferase-like [Agrilus planipennis]
MFSYKLKTIMKFKFIVKFLFLLCLFTTVILYFSERKMVYLTSVASTTTSTSEFGDNQENFEASESSMYSVIILVQVHDRIQYLRELIYSLSKVSGISSALLVFSHDLIDEEINNLIRNVTFCDVLQIYFPYSIQNFPDQFPGDDPNDCPRNIEKTEAIEKNCTSAQFPDKFNHYRESRLCQIKHHWWWKANYVIDSLEVTRNHTGLFLFLEEDFYVLPDLIYVMKKMDGACRNHKDCGGLVMGYREQARCPANELRTVLQRRMGTIGFAIYRKTWELFKNCSENFCTFDEYNWDLSIFHVMKTCLKDQVTLLFSACSPRVLHLGVCGVHKKTKNCENSFNVLKKFYREMVYNHNPEKISVTELVGLVRIPGGNGGWADPRDHELCMSMVNKDMG